MYIHMYVPTVSVLAQPNADRVRSSVPQRTRVTLWRGGRGDESRGGLRLVDERTAHTETTRSRGSECTVLRYTVLGRVQCRSCVAIMVRWRWMWGWQRRRGGERGCPRSCIVCTYPRRRRPLMDRCSVWFLPFRYPPHFTPCTHVHYVYAPW